MTELTIYTPEIRLFTYHLRLLKPTDINLPEKEVDARSIVSYYIDLMEAYGVLDSAIQKSLAQVLKLVDGNTQGWSTLQEEERFQLLQKSLSREDIEYLLLNFVFRSDWFRSASENSFLASHSPILPLIVNREKPGKLGIQRISLFPYNGYFYPEHIHDTYSFLLHLFYPQKEGRDKVLYSELTSLQPPPIFFQGTTHKLENSQLLKDALWGTTIMFNGFIDDAPESVEQGQTSADLLLQKILGIETLEQAPLLLNRGEFLEGWLYEYKNLNQQHRFGHVFILLMFANDTKLKLNAVSFLLPQLFCYDRKIHKNFLDSRQVYQSARQQIGEIEAIITRFPENIATKNLPDLLEQQGLKDLKKEIKNLLDLSLQYSQKMGNLVVFQNTIAINQDNYLDTLSLMEAKSNSDLGFWRDRATERFTKFQRQIAADLIYLQQGERLLDTAINTIRGLVEIDQAERDRILEQQIQTFGTAIAAGAIVASTSAIIFQEPMTFPWQENHGDHLHPFLIALIVSFTFAGIAWQIAKCLINRDRN